MLQKPCKSVYHILENNLHSKYFEGDFNNEVLSNCNHAPWPLEAVELTKVVAIRPHACLEDVELKIVYFKLVNSSRWCDKKHVHLCLILRAFVL